MSVRTYNPSVRVGNWNEDIQLEEDTLKDFLERREKGALLIQQSANVKTANATGIELSVSRTGKVHFGHVCMLMNPAPKDNSRGPTSLSVVSGGADKCGASASSNTSPSSRTACVIRSLDGTPDGEGLRYGQPFYICSAESGMYLLSDQASFTKCAKKSRRNEVAFVREPSHLTEWKVESFNPQNRFELEHTEVPANEKVVLKHVKTNQAMCVEAEHLIRTPFGREYEVSGYTSLDSHKAEKDVNHWQIMMKLPGDSQMPMEPPK